MRKIILINILLFLLFTGFLASCRSAGGGIQKAFYYWKTNEYSLSDLEIQYIKNQKIEKLYVKFFDVVPSDVFTAIPISKTEFHFWNYMYATDGDSSNAQIMLHLQVIPVVYIENQVLLNSSKGSLDTLADNISFLVKKYYNAQIHNNPESFTEIQLDCDWTERSRDNYFYLINKVKSYSKLEISCTLRLYPFKYPDKMGIPPVSKVSLMCYNLINPLSNEQKNSILDIDELKSYLQGSENYPLHLDFALPVFSWMQLYQNNQFVKIINPPIQELDSIVEPKEPMWLEVIKDKEIGNIYLRRGDKIKYEEVTAKILKEAIELLRKFRVDETQTTISLFHLDENNLSRYSHEELSGFYSDFTK